jgi:hypothetical protein
MAVKSTKKTVKKGPAAEKTAKQPAKIAKKAIAKKAIAKNIAANKAAVKKAAPRKATAGATSPLSASMRIDRMIENIGDWRGERLAEIRKLIHDVDPEVVEEWKWMGTPVWSHQGMYALANAHKDKVKLTFFHGAKLADSGKLFNAGLDGGKWRAIDLREGDRIDRPAFKALLREAVAYNTTHAVPKSKGSRA